MTASVERPVVSVCIANYNGEHILPDCIESVLRQNGAPPFEIIVHDDASPDDSLAVLKRYDDVRLIRSTENVGFCVSNNRMAEAARGDFVLLLNNDARLFEDALVTLGEESARLDDRAVLSLPQYDAGTGELIDRGGYLDFLASPVPTRKPSDQDVAMVMGACMWVPKAIWDEIGGFPEWFVTNAEDVYLCCYARALGYRVFVPDRSGYRHIVGSTLGGGKAADAGLTISVRRRQSSERNRTLVQWTFYPWWLIPIVFSINVLMLIPEALALALFNRRLDFLKPVYVDSLASAWRARRHVAAARRALAERGRIPAAEFFRGFRLVPQKLRLLLRHGLPRAQAGR